jgi:acetyl esterase/lipase
VLHPTLTVYEPVSKNGAACIIAPGGAYKRIVLDKEGEEIALWLNSLGITAYVLRYRLPGEGHKQGMDVPLQDAQRALRYIRRHAADWGLNPQQLGIMGFSAGGHVASSLAVKFAQKVYQPLDAIDKEDARPDFVVLAYPVITMQDDYTHQESRSYLLGPDPGQQLIDNYSNQFHVTGHTPPTFIMHAGDDESVPVENSLMFYAGLRKAGIPAELHIFQQGGHGYSIRKTKNLPVASWTLLCSAWFKSLGLPA